ncbi:uncharacterized protein DC041_0004734, partial [Schistosoma bovis]
FIWENKITNFSCSGIPSFRNNSLFWAFVSLFTIINKQILMALKPRLKSNSTFRVKYKRTE